MKIKTKKQKNIKSVLVDEKRIKKKNRTKNKIPEWGSQNTINHTHSCFYSYIMSDLLFFIIIIFFFQ